MKCHCKYCSSTLICLRKSPGDFCYYRHGINQNTTNDDFGCVENDGSKFFCNTTDLFYRTECCSEMFCNVRQRSVTTIKTNSSSVDHSFVLIVVIGLVVIILIILFFRRKFIERFSSSIASSTKTKCSFLDDYPDQNVPLETRRLNKEMTFFGQLGQGRHARVRLVRLGQQYRAIKMFESRFNTEFERERTIFQTDLLEHPNILAFFGVDFFAKGTETCHILIFEWHPNGTLFDVLKENPTTLTIDRLCQYSISLADGLAHLHSIKYGTHDLFKPQMAHCDLKSSNILVKLNGDCCLSDFSLAVRCDPQTQEIQGGGIERFYRRVGTKLYMPPELLHPQPTFHFDRIQSYQLADIYSLTLIFWELAHCFARQIHCRPYENELPLNFTVENLVDLVCRENVRPQCNFSSSDQMSTVCFYSSSMMNEPFEPNLTVSQMIEKYNVNPTKVNETKHREKKNFRCVVCGARAFGYNFDRITCESCKAFFRRNALRNLADLHCRFSGNCSVTIESRRHCSFCRIQKCFKVGMKKEWIRSEEEKQEKRFQSEVNRRRRRTEKSIETLSIVPVLMRPGQLTNRIFLKSDDRQRLNNVNQCYDQYTGEPCLTAYTPPTTLLTLRLNEFYNRKKPIVVHLISYLKHLPELQLLHVDDQVRLIKKNLRTILPLNYAILKTPAVSKFGSTAIQTIGCGNNVNLHRAYQHLSNSFVEFVFNDPLVMKLFLLVLFFCAQPLTSVSIYNFEDFQAAETIQSIQSSYAELLWIYLLERCGEKQAIQFYTKMISKYLQVQFSVEEIDSIIRSNVDIEYLDPLLKTVLQLT